MGVLCDQMLNGTTLTYTSTGLSYQGTPLSIDPTTKTFILGSDSSCRPNNTDKLFFNPGGWHAVVVVGAGPAQWLLRRHGSGGACWWGT